MIDFANNFDVYLQTNPAEKEDEINRKNCDAWLDTETDFEEVSGYLNWDTHDILNYVKDFMNDYDLALEQFKSDYSEDLFDYYLERGV